MPLRIMFLALLGYALAAGPVWAADIAEPLRAVKSVDRNGKGHAEAMAAVRVLERADAADLPVILAAMDDANPLALNWLRGAYESVAARAGAKLPTETLMAFLNDRQHLPQARRLAYDTLKAVDPGLEERLIPALLDDPSGELRRDAVAYTMRQAEKLATDGNKAEAEKKFVAALSGAVDEDQVKQLAEILKKYDRPVNLVEHYGFLTKWKLIGPFNNKDKLGFNVVNPPETELNFDKTYDGLPGADGKPLQVKWKDLVSEDEMGLFDVNKLFEKHMGAAVYTTTQFESASEQAVEFRLGTSNAWKLWLNGELLFAREEYHRGMFVDQYLVRGKLKAGPNTIVLKLLQNEQTEDWAQDWSFQFRVSDFSGRAIHPAK